MQNVDGLLGGSGHPQRVPSVGADDSVAGCSPHFCAAHLRSQKLGHHAIACQYAGYDASKQHRTSGQLRSGSKCVPILCKFMHTNTNSKTIFRISCWRCAIRNIFKVFVVLTERLARN
jgi:hypothetical protein